MKCVSRDFDCVALVGDAWEGIEGPELSRVSGFLLLHIFSATPPFTLKRQHRLDCKSDTFTTALFVIKDRSGQLAVKTSDTVSGVSHLCSHLTRSLAGKTYLKGTILSSVKTHINPQ